MTSSARRSWRLCCSSRTHPSSAATRKFWFWLSSLSGVLLTYRLTSPSSQVRQTRRQRPPQVLGFLALASPSRVPVGAAVGAFHGLSEPIVSVSQRAVETESLTPPPPQDRPKPRHAQVPLEPPVALVPRQPPDRRSGSRGDEAAQPGVGRCLERPRWQTRRCWR